MLREELDELINYELTDPRVGPAAVSEVHGSPDFPRSNVRLTLQAPPDQPAATLSAIEQPQELLTPQFSGGPTV